MKAIIFNSGLGKRMGEFTQTHHKSMAMLKNGETVFARQIRILSECGIREFIVTTGPFHEQLEETAAKFPELTFHFVRNPIYDKTNYIYSMYLARELFDDDVLMLHGDLVFNKKLVEKIIACPEENTGCVNQKLPQPEKDFKARIVDDQIREVSVKIFDGNCYAFQPLYKLSKKALAAWTRRVEQFIEKGTDGVYAENALNELLRDEVKIHAFSYEDDYVDEIDNLDDHARVTAAIRLFDFAEQEIVSGKDSFLSIPTLLEKCGAKKPMLVCDRSSFDFLFLKDYLDSLSWDFVRFDGFSPNPKYDEVKEGVELFRQENCDAILSIGGGSAIDTAKNIKMFAVLNPDEVYLKQELQYSSIPHIAIPTTAGTGSESTHFSVVYYNGEKQSVAQDCMLPDAVVLEPRLLETLPVYQKKSTLLDAMCQCIEAIWSVNTSDTCRKYAKAGLKLILANMDDYLEGKTAANEKIMLGANYGGRAINLSQTTAAHAMSYKITSLFGISHGHAVSLCIPYVWRYLLDHAEESTCPELLQEAFSILREVFRQGDDQLALQVFQKILKKFDLACPALENEQDMELLVKSVNPGRLKNSPVPMDETALQNLYQEIFHPIKVSVIVPVYNVEAYLAECLDSLVKQTLKEIEIVVVNDGATDNSQDIIDQYVKAYPDKIRAFIKENGGLSDARNYGVARARGEYIGFVDSDDFVDLDMFEQMYTKAQDVLADVVCCPITYLKGRVINRSFYKGTYKYFNKTAQSSPMLLRYANSLAPNKIYKRSFWQRHGFMFPRQWFEDSALIYNVMLVANRVDCVNIPFYYYRQGRTDAITTRVDTRIFDIFKSTDSIMSFYRAHGVFDSMYDEIRYLCVRHIIARVKLLTYSTDYELKKQFIDKVYAYLDENLPDWRECAFVKPQKSAGRRTRTVAMFWRHKKLFTMYSCSPAVFRRIAGGTYRMLKKARALPRKLHAKKNTEITNAKKRRAIQANGIPLMALVQKLLSELGIISFADFGTLLGLIREGHLLAHDLDSDMGVIINNEDDLARIKLKLERFGLTPWRQYVYGDKIVEESYRFNGIKVDLNYYRITDKESKTWLFYRAPGVTYSNNERNIVEMHYSPIKNFKRLYIQGYEITIPANAEQLLEEKYGKNWKIPDTGWIYWQSPAATRLEDIGYYYVYRHYKDPLQMPGWQESLKTEHVDFSSDLSDLF